MNGFTLAIQAMAEKIERLQNGQEGRDRENRLLTQLEQAETRLTNAELDVVRLNQRIKKLEEELVWEHEANMSLGEEIQRLKEEK